MRERVITPAAVQPHLFLDCGVEEPPPNLPFTLDERGMIFVSNLKFELGTQLAVGCEHWHPRLGRRTVQLEGIVVWCEKRIRPADQAPDYKTTVLFLDLPDELRQSLREFSRQLPD